MRFVAIDVETANPNMASICQVGVVQFENGIETRCASTLVDPDDWFDPYNVNVHGITEELVSGAPRFSAVLPLLRAWTEGEIVVCHTHFDRVAIAQACLAVGEDNVACHWLDSARVTRRTWPQFAKSGFGLANIAAFCGIEFLHHDALEDARAAGRILLAAIDASGIALADWPTLLAKRTDSAAAIRRQGDGDGPLVGQTIVFTGALALPRREAADRAAEAGADVQSGVTKLTTILVVGDQDIAKLHGRDKSGKHLKAEAMIAAGQLIRIVGETDFMAAVDFVPC